MASHLVVELDLASWYRVDLAGHVCSNTCMPCPNSPIPAGHRALLELANIHFHLADSILTLMMTKDRRNCQCLRKARLSIDL